MKLFDSKLEYQQEDFNNQIKIQEGLVADAGKKEKASREKAIELL